VATVQHALDWAARGFRVFPLLVGQKAPAVDGWTESATTDPAAIREIWGDVDYNVGVLTNGLVVADVDTKAGKRGTASFMALDLPLDTLTVRTPSGGRHVYYSGPSRANTAGKLGDGLDTRSHNGYVIAPGSWLDPEHPKNKGVGGFYQIEHDAPVVAAPPHFLARLDAPRERQATAPTADLDRPDAILRAARFLEDEAPVAVEGDNGDALTFRVAATLKDYGLTQDTALALMVDRWNERCSPPWSSDELRVKVENAYSYGFNPPGSDTGAAIFGDVSLPEAPALPQRNRFRHGDKKQGSRKWLAKKILPERGVGMLVAPSGAGKTFLAIHLAERLARGEPFFGASMPVGGTAILAAEGWDEIPVRLEALGTDTPLPITAFQCGNLSNPDALQRLCDELVDEANYIVKTFNVPMRLVVLDTLAASGFIVDENDNSAVSLALSNLEALAHALNVFILVVHHPGKQGKGARGAGAFRDRVDVLIEVDQESRGSVRTVELTKCRGAPARRLGAYGLDVVKLGVDEDGDDIDTCVVDASCEASPEVEPVSGELFFEALDWCLEDKGEVIEGVTAVDIDIVKREFSERKAGSRDPMRVQAAWRKAASWAASTGGVREIGYFGRRYLAKLQI